MSAEESTASASKKQVIADALALAGSPSAEDHAELLARLESPAFLAQLDDETAYRGRPERLRLRRVLDALARNPAGSAQNVLVALTGSRAFLEEDARIDLLIKASATIVPPPDKVVRFWDAHWRPDDGFSNLTAAAVVQNGHEAAISLLEKKMANPQFEPDEKIHWMHGPMLSHRLDLPLLEGCKRMLETGLPDDLNGKLVETLFDYRPQEWYLPSVPYTPPALETAEKAALVELRGIARMALEKFRLDERLTAQVKKVLEKVEALLDGA